MTMPGFESPLKGTTGRVRTPVGHRYLQALQLRANTDTDGASTTSTTASHEDNDGLNLVVLGMTSGTSMDDIDFALCRFTQLNPEAPLVLDIIQVCHQNCTLEQANAMVQLSANYEMYSMILWLCPQRFEPKSCQCYNKMLPHPVCSLRWMSSSVRHSRMRCIYLPKGTASRLMMLILLDPEDSSFRSQEDLRRGNTGQIYALERQL